MAGLGTIINVSAILIGGLFGKCFGKFFSEHMQDSLSKACGLSVLFIGIAGAISGMMHLEGNSLISGQSLMIVLCLTVGALIGEFLDLDKRINTFGEWLKVKSGYSKEKRFVEGFVTASLTVSIGAMAIVGSIQDGLFHDPSILITKSVLDLIIVMVLTSSLGIGCAFSCIPVALFQGGMTLLALQLKMFLTDTALTNLSLIGSILIFCVGINLIWENKIRVANLLPALLIAILFAFI